MVIYGMAFTTKMKARFSSVVSHPTNCMVSQPTEVTSMRYFLVDLQKAQRKYVK